MAKCWFHHNASGYRQVLRDASTQQECLGVAQSLALSAESAGGGPYVCDVVPGLNRAHARVSTERTWKAFMNEHRTHALKLSVPAGRRKGGKR